MTNKTLGGVYNMQERFAIRKTLKKVAAVGTSVAMLGMSLTGALAQSTVTLANYPSPFTGSDAVVVIGSDPNANADNAAASDVSFGLGQASVSTGTTTAPSTTNAGTVTLDAATAYRKDVTLGTALNATTALGSLVREVTFPGLKKGTVTLAHSSSSTTNTYAWHEEITFPDVLTAPVTGLTLGRNAFNNKSSENFKDNILVYLPTGGMRYTFKFDNDLKTNNMIANSSVTDPYVLDFLGKSLIIEGATATSITALSGDRFSGLHVDDSVVIAGKNVMIEAIGTSSVAVSVDGVTQTISNNNQRSFNTAGLQVRVEDLIATGTSGEGKSSVTLIVGPETAIKTYNDGDEFVGQNKDNPFWIWSLSGLTGATPTLGVKTNPSLTGSTSGSDYPNYGLNHPLYVGDLLCLPNNYVCLTMEAVTQPDDTFGKYHVFTTTRDLYGKSTDTAAIASSADVVAIEALGQSANTGLKDAGGTDTSSIFLYNNASGMYIFRKDVSSSKAIRAGGVSELPAYVNNAGGLGVVKEEKNYNLSVFSVSYKSSSVPVDIRFSNATVGASEANFTLRINPSGTNNAVLINSVTESGRTAIIGASRSDTTKANDVQFAADGEVGNGVYGSGGSMSFVDISGYKQKTRTPDGIVFDAYDATDSSDEVNFWVPADITNYKVWVKLAKPVGGVDGTVTPGTGSSGGPAIKKDTDVLANLASWNVITVGGPAVNQVTANLLGVSFPTYGPQLTGLQPNEAVIELKANGNKWAVLAYGWEADNTRAAGLVLRNYKDFAGKLTGSSVVVKHTSLAVSGITVQ